MTLLDQCRGRVQTAPAVGMQSGTAGDKSAATWLDPGIVDQSIVGPCEGTSASERGSWIGQPLCDPR